MTPLLSVAVALTTKVPFAAYVVVKLAPVPVVGLPPGADQEKVNGAVPPVAEALQVTGLPAVAEPQVTVTTIGWPLITTLTTCDEWAGGVAESVAVPFTRSVPLAASVAV